MPAAKRLVRRADCEVQIVFAALGQFGDPEGTGHERGRHFNILRQLSNLVIA